MNILDFRCPRCGAGPGAPCVAPDLRPTNTHTARTDQLIRYRRHHPRSRPMPFIPVPGLPPEVIAVRLVQDDTVCAKCNRPIKPKPQSTEDMSVAVC